MMVFAVRPNAGQWPCRAPCWPTRSRLQAGRSFGRWLLHKLLGRRLSRRVAWCYDL